MVNDKYYNYDSTYGTYILYITSYNGLLVIRTLIVRIKESGDLFSITLTTNFYLIAIFISLSLARWGKLSEKTFEEQ